MRNKIILIASIGLLSLMLMAAIAAAEVKIFTHTVKQPFGGSQSPDDARIGAVAKAKREVLEKAGTYLESLTVVKNNVVERDEILGLAAGVLNTEILSQENYATKDAFGVIITARIQVDTSVLEGRIEKMKLSMIAVGRFVLSPIPTGFTSPGGMFIKIWAATGRRSLILPRQFVSIRNLIKPIPGEGQL